MGVLLGKKVVLVVFCRALCILLATVTPKLSACSHFSLALPPSLAPMRSLGTLLMCDGIRAKVIFHPRRAPSLSSLCLALEAPMFHFLEFLYAFRMFSVFTVTIIMGYNQEERGPPTTENSSVSVSALRRLP